MTGALYMTNALYMYIYFGQFYANFFFTLELSM